MSDETPVPGKELPGSGYLAAPRASRPGPSTIVRRRARRVILFLLAVPVPNACLYFDPIVFGGASPSFPGYLSRYAPLAYVAIALAIATYLVRSLQKRAPAFLAGCLGGAAILALALGVLLLPLSMAGILLFFIGILGLLPFATGLAYLHTARDAFLEAAARNLPRRWSHAFIGCVGVLIIPCLVQVAADRQLGDTVTLAASEDPPTAHAAIETLRTSAWMRWCVERCPTRLDPIVLAWERIQAEEAQASTPAKRDLAQALEASYRDLTAESIDYRLEDLRD
jgi:hypothetical protein